MGVPALFRWLSKKYPKIVFPVVEEEEQTMPGPDGNGIPVPLDISQPNPNGAEFDNLYLDMNGIVHPCTHPEGKPAPETEEEMMLEVFTYTERVVNMIRPRKMLFMAIDGVAPRAKMNQQRSRRFRSAQEAKDKEEALKESHALWEAMGKTVSDEEKNKVSWDSNAITPGTPFMSLLASSLRYWVVQKINTDPGWKNIQVLISDASVPGEGEHKIMDFIRRQRSNPGYDVNTRHVIYGLDADLIMLALATHEPNFRVLREDVFAQDTSPTACRRCGQEGHYAAQCTGEKAPVEKKPMSKKPFIFLDVSILREYLEVELNIPTYSFPFNFEQAIDDWVLLIFFVGNDFLPHLPSLEIREGAIDTLMRIWKQELDRMGGYLTSHGHLELARAQIILEGLAKREDEIFRKRREAEERQDQNAKRRKLEQQNNKDGFTGPSPSLALTANPTTPSSLPPRPSFDFAAKADSIGLGAAATSQSIQNVPAATQALAGSNRDIVANRRAIRMANLSAADVLRAEMSGLVPVKPSLPQKPAAPPPPPSTTSPLEASRMSVNQPVPVEPVPAPPVPTNDAPMDDADDVPGLGIRQSNTNGASASDVTMSDSQPTSEMPPELDFNTDADEVITREDGVEAGAKRKFDEGPGEDEAAEDAETIEDDDDAPSDAATTSLALKVNADGTVEQEDSVKLWEPGYRERYYKQKFGIEYTDIEARKKITECYVEGLAWVLAYYYQGEPSWQWYYPYHFAPFAADFGEIDKMEIRFDTGQPFKPFEQLMGVFPAASRKLIPETFWCLMTEEDSPIIDFYPSTFEIDMNGKKMAWQGVALLPFIDQKRLLDAMATRYPGLTDEEVKRNQWGNNAMFVSDEHPMYPIFESLYGKKKNQEPTPLDPRLSSGLNGLVLPNPDCLPGSTYSSPLQAYGKEDIQNDRSLSAFYFFPKQLTPHRSVLLPGARRPPRQLTAEDLQVTRNGGRGRGRGGYGNHGTGRGGNWAQGGADRPNRNDPFHTRAPNYGGGQQSNYNNRGRGGPPNRGDYGAPRNYGGGGGGRGGGYQQQSYNSRPQYQNQPPSQSQYGGYGGGGGSGGYGGGNGGGGYGGGNGGGGYGGGGNGGGYGGGYGGGGGYGSNNRPNPPSQNYGGYGGYGGGGRPQQSNYGGPPQNGYGGYNDHGGYGGGGGGGYNANNALSYQNNSRGGAPYNSGRGRGRGW